MKKIERGEQMNKVIYVSHLMKAKEVRQVIKSFKIIERRKERMKIEQFRQVFTGASRQTRTRTEHHRAL